MSSNMSALGDSVQEALRMVSAFADAGAPRFDLTHLHLDGEIRGFRAGRSLTEVRESIPRLVPASFRRQNNVIIRPHSGEAQIIQLDDLNAEQLARVTPVAFLTLRTSPGNHQAWVAVDLPRGAGEMAVKPSDFARRLRKRMGADPSASGATRLAGTLNFKRKYEPDFPVVTIVESTQGRVVTAAQLETLGLVAPPEPPKPAPALRVSRGARSAAWPDYARCIADAPPNHSKEGPDISRADFTWCIMAARRHFSEEAIAAKLLELSRKAQEDGNGRYASLTARKAFGAVEAERSR
jgi:hypothetical protein